LSLPRNRTTFETSQTDTHGVGSARSLRLKSSSQKNPSQYCDTALMRHTFRTDCTEAKLGVRIRYSDNVSGPLPTSTVVLPNCVHRPVHQVGISIPRDATDRPLPVSHAARDPQVKDTVLLRDCAERATRRNLVVTVTKLRHMPPRTVEHRAESEPSRV
jgi:hypothetical protein